MSITKNNESKIMRLMMEMAMGSTVEERTEAFKQWVEEKILVAEQKLNTDKNHLNYKLHCKEPIHTYLFNKMFENHYFFIREYMNEAKWRAKEAGVLRTTLDEALELFKQLKRKIRNTKSEYKKAFADLRKEQSYEKEDKLMMKNAVVNEERQNGKFSVSVVDGKYMVIDDDVEQIFLATLYMPDTDMKVVLGEKTECLSELYKTYSINLIKHIEVAVAELDALVEKKSGSSDSERRLIIQRLYDYSNEGIEAFSQMAIRQDLAGAFVTNLLDSLMDMQDVVRTMENDYIAD